MSSKIEPKFYAVDALNAYPEPVGTDDKLELNQEMGAVYVHLNYKRAKLVGLQSLDFLIRNLELIRVEALGPRAAPVVERQPSINLCEQLVHQVLSVCPENYAGHTFGVTANDGSVIGDIIITVVKPDGKSPHDLRIEAENELAELQATIARLETKLNNAINLDFERRAEIERLKGGQGEPVALAVWYGPMPESNGKTNWTAILHRKGYPIWEGSCITLDRSEYPERVLYEADRARYLIGELEHDPDITSYDAEKHSGYVSASQPAPVSVWVKSSERDPKLTDLDQMGRVLVWNEFSQMAHLLHVDHLYAETFYTHWQKLPESPNACLDKVKELNQ